METNQEKPLITESPEVSPAKKNNLTFNLFKNPNRKKVVATIFSILFLTGAIGVGVYLNQSVKKTGTSAANPTISLSSNNMNPAVGASFVVAVTMNTQGSSVTGTDLRIRYDAARLTGNSITVGGFLPQVWIPGAISGGAAAIILGPRFNNAVPPVPIPATGTGLLAQVNFTARVAGSTTISVDPATKVHVSGSTTNMLGATTPVTVNVGGGTQTATPVPTTGTNTPPKGNFDGINCTNINGWACDPNNYNTALQVHFYDGQLGAGGVLIGSSTANVSREAGVATQCGNVATHGFSFPVPNSVKTGTNHSIYVYAINIPAGTNPLLAGSPRTINCPAVAPTPTRTPTATPVRTATAQPTRTPTRTPTATPVRTATVAPTRTPTRTPTATPVRTATAQPTRTPTRTPTATPVRTATAFPTNTPTTEPTFAPTDTPLATATATATPIANVPGDVDGDGFVTIVDIGIIIDNYDLQPLPDPRADLDGDGIANIVDIGIVVDNYGL